MNSNINIPPIPAFVSGAIITHDSTEYLPCEIFACRLALNNSLTFHVMLESGVMYHNLPISVFKWNKNSKTLNDFTFESIQKRLSWWDSQGNTGECIQYAYLKNSEVVFKNRKGAEYRGKYLFTIEEIYDSNMPLGYSGDISAKCHHFIKLDNGYFAISPNTFLRWDCGDNFVDWKVSIPKLKTNRINVSSEFKNK